MPLAPGEFAKPGDVAPLNEIPIELVDHLGKAHSRDLFKDKKTVLWFYPKASTPN